MVEYLPIFILFAVAFIFVFASFLVSGLISPRKPTGAKTAPYECGIVPTREPARRFPVRFYLVAMIFIIFDIEIIFLYPWAVRFHALGTFGLVEMIAFTVPVIVALAYLVSNGALSWGPMRRTTMTEEERKTDATIRYIHKPAVPKGEAV
jgi:NADH-quinone oxidoreductase subunit A